MCMYFLNHRSAPLRLSYIIPMNNVLQGVGQIIDGQIVDACCASIANTKSFHSAFTRLSIYAQDEHMSGYPDSAPYRLRLLVSVIYTISESVRCKP